MNPLRGRRSRGDYNIIFISYDANVRGTQCSALYENKGVILLYDNI